MGLIPRFVCVLSSLNAQVRKIARDYGVYWTLGLDCVLAWLLVVNCDPEASDFPGEDPLQTPEEAALTVSVAVAERSSASPPKPAAHSQQRLSGSDISVSETGAI